MTLQPMGERHSFYPLLVKITQPPEASSLHHLESEAERWTPCVQAHDIFLLQWFSTSFPGNLKRKRKIKRQRLSTYLNELSTSKLQRSSICSKTNSVPEIKVLNRK